MKTYEYDFSAFLNDTVDAQKLQNEILDSAIGATLEGLTVEYESEKTFIDFQSALNSTGETILDGIVAAHDGIPYTDEGEGWTESDSENGTTSSEWQEKLDIDFNCIVPDSEFKCYWYAEVSSSDTNVCNEFRVILDGSTVLMEIRMAFYKKNSEGHREPIAGWKYFPVEIGDHTISLQYRNIEGKTTYIRNARLHVEEE